MKLVILFVQELSLTVSNATELHGKINGYSTCDFVHSIYIYIYISRWTKFYQNWE